MSKRSAVLIAALLAAFLLPAAFAQSSGGGHGGGASFPLTNKCANPASIGALRLCVTDLIAWRNNANSADLTLGIDGSDNWLFGTAQTFYFTLDGSAVSANYSWHLPANIAAGLFNTDGSGNMSYTLSPALTSVTGAANTALTVQGGIDATTTGASGNLLAKSEDVNGGSTASLSGGATTLRGGDNASTGNSSAGGAVTVRGGDATGGTGTSDTAGNATIRGGNCTSTTGSCTPGTASLTSGGFSAAFTNGAGSDTTIAAGLGTGNAAVSHVKIQSPALSQTSGTTAETQVTRYVTHVKAGSTTSATATNLFNVALANNQTAGVMVFVHVETTQATPHNCSTDGLFFFVAQDTGGTITQQTQAIAATPATICDTGTLTLTATASAAAPTVFSVTPSWTTIVPTAVTITIEILNASQQDISLL